MLVLVRDDAGWAPGTGSGRNGRAEGGGESGEGELVKSGGLRSICMLRCLWVYDEGPGSPYSGMRAASGCRPSSAGRG